MSSVKVKSSVFLCSSPVCVALGANQHTLPNFLVLTSSGGGGKEPSSNHALIMDEVDGMSGNEDRGGVQELIALIKKSKIPIITMCNDRNHPKIRSLANHCFDLRFSKPRIEQIRVRIFFVVETLMFKIQDQSFCL